MALADLFKGQEAGKEGLADTHVRVVGRGWGNAFPTSSVFDVRTLPTWLFGEPTLSSANNGSANWALGGVSPLDQKGNTSWLANLYGGDQTGDDWARVNIPVNEMLLEDLVSAQWSYYMSAAETMGVNMVIWMHDPTDPDKRAEITQLANVAGLAKGSGWNSHILAHATVQFFFYGENTTGTGLTAGTQYTLTQFQQDALFSRWTIYRITLEYGWEASGTFDDAWVVDVKINGVVIPLKPDSGGSGRIAQRFYTGAVALATALAPKTPFRLISMNLHLNAAATQQTFTLTCDATRGSAYDTLLVSQAMAAVTDVAQTFEGLDFLADDEIDGAWTNTDTKTYGLTLTYQTVF